MAEASLAVAYYALVVLFEVVLAGAILAGGRGETVRGALATVLLANAAEAAGFFGAHVLALDVDVRLNRVLDTVIVLSLLVALSQLPVPLAARPQFARRAWLAALVVAPVLLVTLPRTPQDLTWTLLHDVPFVAAAAVLAAHTVPKAMRLPPGPLRRQALLVAAAIGIGFGYIATLNVLGQIEGFAEGRFSPISAGVFGAMLYYALAAAAQLLLHERGVEARTYAAILLAGPTIAAVEHFLLQATPFGTPLAESVTQTIRPALVAIAILRYDLVSVPSGARRPLSLATIGFLSLVLYVQLAVILSGRGLDAQTLAPVPSLIAGALVGLLAYLARRPLLDMLEAGRGTPAARLARYRLELERRLAEGHASPATTAALRDELGITQAEHDALVSVLHGHVLLPLRAVHGAREGDLVGARYRVRRELGRGGQGRALLARDENSGAEVVLKESLRPWEGGRAEGLRRELRAVARHPAVARSLDLVQDEAGVYLVREYVPGRTLDTVVEEGGPLTQARAAAICREVLAALDALHAQGVLHLDIKPGNVVLREDGGIALIDLGVSRASDPAATAATAPLGGTRGWMAPEQALGLRVDERTDLFAVAALHHFLVTGRIWTPGAEAVGPLASALSSAVELRPASARAMIAALDAPTP